MLGRIRFRSVTSRAYGNDKTESTAKACHTHANLNRWLPRAAINALLRLHFQRKALHPLAANRAENDNEIYTTDLDLTLDHIRNTQLLTESEVSRSWTRLFKNGLSQEAFESAEVLLDELRPESPLRHRLEGELVELRDMHTTRVNA